METRVVLGESRLSLVGLLRAPGSIIDVVNYTSFSPQRVGVVVKNIPVEVAAIAQPCEWGASAPIIAGLGGARQAGEPQVTDDERTSLQVQTETTVSGGETKGHGNSLSGAA
jgi:hypothetical protein